MFPLAHTVKLIRRNKIGENALGQPIYSDTPTVVERHVYGFRPRRAQDSSVDENPALDDRSISELYLLAPDGDYVEDDVIELPNGRRYEVKGEIEDLNFGPFGFKPGYRLIMRRVHDGQA